MDREDGEMSEDFDMEVEDAPTFRSTKHEDEPSAVIYKADKAGPVIKKLEKVDASKLEERAARFGLNLTGTRVVTQKQIDELYSNCGVKSNNERHFRFDALHLNGVSGLSTREIFEYLEDFKPVSLEWVDDNSCNIVCQDHIAAALALLVHSRDIAEDLKTLVLDQSNHYWREGIPHPKKDLILMRFATNAEKTNVSKRPHPRHNDDYDKSMKSVSKNPWGDLCQSWGVYDHQEILQRKLVKDEFEEEVQEQTQIRPKNKNLAHRLGTKTVEIEDSSSDSETEWNKKSKAPRMRMHADDIEEKQKKREYKEFEDTEDVERDMYAPLSIEVPNISNTYTPRESTNTTRLSDKFKKHARNDTELKKNSIHSRLGSKVIEQSNDSFASDDSQDIEPDNNIQSRVNKINSDRKKQSSIWSRLESSPKTNKNSDLRQILKSKKDTKKTDDLRSRLGKFKQSNLRIEISNK